MNVFPIGSTLFHLDLSTISFPFCLIYFSNLWPIYRIKSGSPGFFVIFNPTDLPHLSNFTADHKLPDKMTVSYLSENYNHNNGNANATKVAQSTKVNLNELQVAPHSTIVLTYVPVKSE